MSSTRPRRSIQPTNYKETKGSDSEDSDSTSSLSEVTDSDEDSQRVIHLPTPAGIIQTETLIRVQNEELATVDAEYQALKRKIKVVEMKRNVALQRLLKTKSQLARIRTLPQEVLGYIFLFYMEDPSHSPWTLMQVTRTWRATALSTRTIWAKIMLTSPAWKKYGSSRWKNGREVCGSSDQLDRALRRAGNSPLDIMISLNSPLGNNFRQYDKKAIASMLELLASTRKCLQVHYLHIDGRCCGVTWPDDTVSLQFPELKTFRVRSPYCYQFVVGLSTSSKQLMELHIQKLWSNGINNDNSTQTFIAVEQLTRSPRMTRVSIDDSAYRTLFRSDVQALYRALNNARFLTTLELIGISYSRANDGPAPMLQIPQLRVLILSNGYKALSFDAPSLISVTLMDGSVIPEGPPGSNEFPHLTSLTIASPFSWQARYHLGAMHFPPLHTLDICFGTRTEVLLNLMDRRNDLNPLVFRLRKTIVSTEIFIHWIGSMDRLEELQLESVSIKKRFFEFLASRKTELQNLTGLEVMACPSLVRLQVDLKSESSIYNSKLQTAAKKAANARRKAGILIEKWLVRSANERP